MLMCMLLQVINEALRCGNIVKFVHRKALKDVRYKGKHTLHQHRDEAFVADSICAHHMIMDQRQRGWSHL